MINIIMVNNIPGQISQINAVIHGKEYHSREMKITVNGISYNDSTSDNPVCIHYISSNGNGSSAHGVTFVPWVAGDMFETIDEAMKETIRSRENGSGIKTIYKITGLD